MVSVVSTLGFQGHRPVATLGRLTVVATTCLENHRPLPSTVAVFKFAHGKTAPTFAGASIPAQGGIVRFELAPGEYFVEDQDRHVLGAVVVTRAHATSFDVIKSCAGVQ